MAGELVGEPKGKGPDPKLLDFTLHDFYMIRYRGEPKRIGTLAILEGEVFTHFDSEDKKPL